MPFCCAKATSDPKTSSPSSRTSRKSRRRAGSNALLFMRANCASSAPDGEAEIEAIRLEGPPHRRLVADALDHEPPPHQAELRSPRPGERRGDGADVHRRDRRSARPRQLRGDPAERRVFRPAARRYRPRQVDHPHRVLHLVDRRDLRPPRGDLLAAGVRIFEYKKTLLHQKIIIVDGIWSCVGSTNFDDRSFQLNDEVTIGFTDRRIAQKLRKAWRDDLRFAEEIHFEEWRSRAATHKL